MDVDWNKFIEEQILSGPLVKARERTVAGTAQPKNVADWPKISTWMLVCEEILDTEHDQHWYDDIIAELGRRDFGDEDVDKLRAFAWRTAGWLNWAMCLWEWANLDARDINLALQLQLDKKLINQQQYDDSHVYMEYIEAGSSLLQHPPKNG
jgi:hypothetical protein